MPLAPPLFRTTFQFVGCGIDAFSIDVEALLISSLFTFPDLQISDWAPSANSRGNPKLLTRSMSYTKPLNASIGPRQTKCELSDEVVHCDFNDYSSTVTTTRAPEVPSGNVFVVKTRTCIMWASSRSSRIVVTTQVEWTGRSFIKGKFPTHCEDCGWMANTS